MCSLRDAAKDFEALGVKVFGISRDDVTSIAKFAADQELNFALLSDPDGSVTGKYDADMQGRPFAARITFVIDDAGVLRARDEEVNVTSHGQDLVARIRELKG